MKTFALFLLASLFVSLHSANAQFVVNKEDIVASKAEQEKAAASIAKHVAKKWSRANKQFSRSFRKEVVKNAEVVYAPRLVGRKADADTTLLELSPSHLPVGYVELVSGGVSLGYAVVTESAGKAVTVFESSKDSNGALAQSEADAKRAKIVSAVKEKGAFCVQNVDKEGQLFVETDGTFQTVDIANTQTASFAKDDIPAHSYQVKDSYDPKAVILSVAGGAVAVAIIVIAAL